MCARETRGLKWVCRNLVLNGWSSVSTLQARWSHLLVAVFSHHLLLRNRKRIQEATASSQSEVGRGCP